MSRLIYADEAKENACKWECGGDPSCPYSKSNGITHEQCEFMRAIDECRTIDAVSVVHAKWVKKEKIFESGITYARSWWYECSNCGEKPFRQYNAVIMSDYCPWCGAVMDGEKVTES